MSGRSRPRPRAPAGVAPLAATPLDGGGIREVLCWRARPASPLAAGSTIHLWSPCTSDGRRPSRPSELLAAPPELEELRGAEPRGDAPLFEFDGATLRAQVRFPPGTSFHGAGLAAAPLRRDGRVITLWNTDAFAYGPHTPALYQSHPCVLAVLADGRAVVLLADSIRRGSLALAPDGVELAFEEEPFDLYRIEAPDPARALRGLAALVGTLELPPLWALGYHQCRWSYASAEELRALARTFRARQIPCDALWLDIDHMERFRVFTWDARAFPDPAGLVRELHAQGFRCVAIVDPGVAARKDFELDREGLAGGHFVLDERGAPVQGRVWPGPCHFPDFTSERTRAWWAGKVEGFARAAGLDGIWNDMNEPAVFRTPTKTLPETARGAGGTHARWHNLYGQLMAEAAQEGLRRARPEQRPFVLTRASHVSGARFAASWTGDNQARWEDLAWSIPMLLSLGLSGQPFAGADVGGFAGDPSPELFARWFEAASLLPFFRGHSDKTSCRKEPWSFGPETEALVRRAIERRMRLLPTLYTLFHAAATEGLPVARPMFFADPVDPALRTIDDAFLLGDALLVAPIVEQGKRARTVVLPRGPWYAFDPLARRAARRVAGTTRARATLGTLPLFARAGSIVFACEPAECAARGFGETLTAHVFLDDDGRASGRVYEDEGEGYGYREGRSRLASFEARTSGGEIELVERSEGRWDGGTGRRTFRVHDGKRVRVLERERT